MFSTDRSGSVERIVGVMKYGTIRMASLTPTSYKEIIETGGTANEMFIQKLHLKYCL